MSIDVGTKLDSLEYKIRADFDNSTDIEVKSCEQKIRRLTDEIENLLNEYRFGSLAQTDSMRKDLLDSLNELTDVIIDTRDEEKRDSLEALQSTSIELEQTIEDLERFNEEGIRPTGQDDHNYGKDTKDIIDRETNKFIQEYGIDDEELEDEIRKKMKSMESSLITTHEDLSVRMKNSIREQVERVGLVLVAEKEKSEVAKDEKSKGDNDFASKLSSQTVSEEELAENDAKDLENEQTFKGSEPVTTTIEELES